MRPDRFWVAALAGILAHCLARTAGLPLWDAGLNALPDASDYGVITGLLVYSLIGKQP
jgi:hypothetical protein